MWWVTRLQQLLLIPHAFAFADGRMREVLDVYCQQPKPGEDYLLLDEHDVVTEKLESTNARVIEAYEWLRLRGQARLIHTDHGDRIRVKPLSMRQSEGLAGLSGSDA